MGISLEDVYVSLWINFYTSDLRMTYNVLLLPTANRPPGPLMASKPLNVFRFGLGRAHG